MILHSTAAIAAVARPSHADIDAIIAHSMAENTRIAYQKGWNRFQNYCNETGRRALPAAADTVAEFLAHIGNNPVGKGGKMLSMSTVQLNVCAINKVHKLCGYGSPTNHAKVQLLVSGLKKMRGGAVRRVMALQGGHVKKMIASCEGNLTGIRNAAILALGFSAALRRSELAELKVGDIKFVSGKGKRLGILLTIRKSKTDQEGLGQKIAIPYGKNLQTIERLQRWIAAAGLEREDYLFSSVTKSSAKKKRLHYSDVPRIVKHYARKIGLDAAKIAGHSLRAGFVTSAVIARARLDKIMEVTRHKNPATLLAYMRDTEVFSNHAGRDFL